MVHHLAHGPTAWPVWRVEPLVREPRYSGAHVLGRLFDLVDVAPAIIGRDCLRPRKAAHGILQVHAFMFASPNEIAVPRDISYGNLHVIRRSQGHLVRKPARDRDGAAHPQPAGRGHHGAVYARSAHRAQ